MTVLYEDNHLLIINKAAGEIVQGDKTGDCPLVESLKVYLKEKYDKPGNVFLGLVHRLDRPVSGIVVFAKTSKALTRMNELFRKDEVRKIYHAIVEASPARPEADLVHFLKKNEKQNKSYPVGSQVVGAKRAELSYRTLAHSDRYTLLEVTLKTGRHHQIRAQLSANGTIIKGDLKYGARRSNADGSISLHAYSIEFVHPVSKEKVRIIAPYPDTEGLWKHFK
ncbi:RluA family pseudouridine synthase [Porphyromonas cangingivalis]|uniref:23S rRNA pseudouridine1911/1915/1917 synthase n=1 Tax=Porphyromonas cangingivalis TaxID=36874 RepID=A0A099WUG2_PORCN|nr:RluA family pseudouridine synthase [Porphyromonas cangingivalis]KGL48301.1 pseudouridine synthase [Porphyromonas cangingivalis]KGN81739.1 pseudouridine synthase [Porphyromonas cangingivalis]SJZ67112.1 23S rRNA pseudouridine1911/1915/1917 synthase [Porphyromonas cangingivalis]SPY35684.1 Ribosomal large subunit pseudouridine synthase C [Porphyromonas cangingivalis]VEJ04252.1 Ribosomal large subunit pseudouridine synthase C [Porphyromonas cangingivalis]